VYSCKKMHAPLKKLLTVRK